MYESVERIVVDVGQSRISTAPSACFRPGQPKIREQATPEAAAFARLSLIPIGRPLNAMAALMPALRESSKWRKNRRQTLTLECPTTSVSGGKQMPSDGPPPFRRVAV